MANEVRGKPLGLRAARAIGEKKVGSILHFSWANRHDIGGERSRHETSEGKRDEADDQQVVSRGKHKKTSCSRKEEGGRKVRLSKGLCKASSLG
jgi:hypothetical protein